MTNSEDHLSALHKLSLTYANYLAMRFFRKVMESAYQKFTWFI